jgi:hypothetical protein
MADVKVFRLNDCDWYAGASIGECVADYVKTVGIAIEEAVDKDARELTDADMERLKFHDFEDEGESGKVVVRTFKEQLALLIERGVEFPTFFASTEY